MEFERESTCCFTGHRPKKLDMLSEEQIKLRLTDAIEQAISDGFTTFISGMAQGVDTWAAEIVLQKQKSNSEIKLVCALPYEKFQSRSKQASDIKQKAYEVIAVSEKSSRECYQTRNKFMVDNSQRVICVFNGTSGGTKNTIDYVKRKNVECINVI